MTCEASARDGVRRGTARGPAGAWAAGARPSHPGQRGAAMPAARAPSSPTRTQTPSGLYMQARARKRARAHTHTNASGSRPPDAGAGVGEALSPTDRLSPNTRPPAGAYGMQVLGPSRTRSRPDPFAPKAWGGRSKAQPEPSSHGPAR